MLLQGRPAPPNQQWVVPVSLSLQPVGGGGGQNEIIMTDSAGTLSMTVQMPPGDYVWRAKNSHTLANSGRATLSAGVNTVQIGTLLEGDANDDNCVSIVDLNLFRTAFGSAFGDPGYNPNTDFNGDGGVNISDFSLMRGNFGVCGATVSPGSRVQD